METALDALRDSPCEGGVDEASEIASPCARAHMRETVVAEKLEAMLKLGMANSRMEDSYDLGAFAQLTTVK